MNRGINNTVGRGFKRTLTVVSRRLLFLENPQHLVGFLRFCAVAFCICVAMASRALATQPVVAIHDSELTRALETTPASGSTPTGPGTTGFQWWPTEWHYFVMPESLKEALKSDGTSFTVVGDSNIVSGALTNVDGSPAYPIVISLASEAISDSEIAQFTNYVAGGGILFVGSSAFTRNPNGTSRGDFAIANALGAHMAVAGLENYAANQTFTRVANHRLVSHIPGGQLRWRMPNAADEISSGVSPNHSLTSDHLLWEVVPSDATVLAQGDSTPYLLVKAYGKGVFIYDAATQPLMGHGGWAPSMYSYVIFRRAIEWAFELNKLPVPKLSPWPYAYNAVMNVRHDFENWSNAITAIELSAQYESNHGVKGEYYFCTGTLRAQMTNSPAIVASLRSAVTNYGAMIGPHNGGLANPNNPALTLGDFDYFHWGPDEALSAPGGYASGQSYGFTSLSNAFLDVEGWLTGITNGLRTWVSPSFNATREGSLQILEGLGVKATGEQKIGPFPSWALSTSLSTSGKRYPFVSLPTSEWFIHPEVSESVDSETGQGIGSIREMVDYYYGLGALINAYSHSSAAEPLGGADSMHNVEEFITYTVAKPNVWAANAADVYLWWVKRATATVTPSFTMNGNQSRLSFAVQGSSDSRTSVEAYLPCASVSGLQVLTNGVSAPSDYRTNNQIVKVWVGTSVTNVEIRYVANPQAVGDNYTVASGATLTVPAPGVLTNDSLGAGSSLTASLVGTASHGSLTLNGNGSFTYTPTAGYTGVDSFTYKVSDGVNNSASAVVTIDVTPTGHLFFDDFARSSLADPLAPWVSTLGQWTITNGVAQGLSAGTGEFADLIVGGTWGD
ncbi:MAG TPA: Ig-like domain-containing protein, partial [Verrucomicrobiae bacterium]|nr:Ig-like domain-containing protein [Verrucomicrobiae bacterium]